MISLTNKTNETIEIDEFKNIGIFCNDSKYLLSLMKEITGINYSNYQYNGKMLFDNKEYFKNRVFINNDYQYIKKLNTKLISENLLNKYAKVLREDNFKMLVRASHLRFYTQNKVKLATEPTAIANNCLAFSVMGIRIIHNFLYYINDNDAINVFIKELNNNKGNIISDSSLNISKYKSCLDCAYVFNKTENGVSYYCLNNKHNTLLKYNNISLNQKLENYLVYKDEENNYYFDEDMLKDKETYIYLKAFSYKEVKLEMFGE